ncbi:MAG: cytidine deaminase [Thermodesulfovibrionales bacterium]
MTQEQVEALVARASEALRNSIAPYSGFKVGAALMAEDGSIFTGANIENPSLMLSFCAERAALIKALTEGRRSFKALAIVSGDGSYCYPCGACRQMLMEFAPGLRVFLASEKGIKKYSIGEFMPFPFKAP